MNGRTLAIAVVAAIAGLIAGFLLANSINRNELSALRSENESLKSASSAGSTGGSKSDLSEDEINATIARADQSPGDLQTQRNVGIAIYRYAAMKQDGRLIAQSVRILERAATLAPNDLDVILSLGNAHFDIGYFGKDNAALAKSREYYAKVLDAKPDNVEVRTDVGLSYFLETPPDFEQATREFRKSLEQNPRHEKTLQFMVQTLIKQNKPAEASQYLDQLRSVNPRNESIAELSTMLATAQPTG